LGDVCFRRFPQLGNLGLVFFSLSAVVLGDLCGSFLTQGPKNNFKANRRIRREQPQRNAEKIWCKTETLSFSATTVNFTRQLC